MKKLFLTLPVIILLSASCNLSSQTPASRGNITMYPVQCNDWFPSDYQRVNGDNNSNEPMGDARNFKNCLQPKALGRIDYNVDKDNQLIIRSDPDSVNTGFSKYKDCTIIDINNWSCGNFAYEFGFKNGVAYDNGFTHVVFVNKSQWDSINDGKPSPASELK